MNRKRVPWAVALILGLLVFSGPALAAEWQVSYTANPGARHETAICDQDAEGERYLFLPASADLSALRLEITGAIGPFTVMPGDAILESGQPFDLLSLSPQEPEDGVYSISLTAADGQGQMDLRIMRSARIASVHIASDDPEGRGRAWVEGFEMKVQETTTASMVMLGADGRRVYDGKLREIRGRGNTTWMNAPKKPYQIKLETPTDLLRSGNPENRTWVLLAESFDATMLHNSVSLDLGQELGLPQTPEYVPVDLYYDGEYRGSYLLAEKVQVNPGRVDIWDYEEYIEHHYFGQTPLEDLPVQGGTNEYGSTYDYIEGLDISLGAQGAYLLELNTIFFGFEKCRLTTNQGAIYTPESPKLLSRGDMDYLSCLLQEMEDTILNLGVHPENDKTLDQYIDIASFADVFLVNAFAKTCDFGRASTFFYIPQGESKLYAGPLWDFDIAYAMRDTRPSEMGVEDYLQKDGLFYELMKLPMFQDAVKEHFEVRLLPMLTEILLGTESAQGKFLRSLAGYTARIDASQRMNYKLWKMGGDYFSIHEDTLYPTYGENIAYFRQYLEGRSQWLAQDIAQWANWAIDEIRLDFFYRNANIFECLVMEKERPYNNWNVSRIEWETVQNPEAPSETLYTATVTLAANERSAFGPEPSLWVNGYPVRVKAVQEKTLQFDYSFWGPTFAPALYDGVDYALLYQYDYFLAQNPEIIEECGTGPEDVLEYYVYYGISDGLRAIATYDVETFLENYQGMLDAYYMSDVEMSTLHYLEHAYEEELLGMPEAVYPAPAEY